MSKTHNVSIAFPAPFLTAKLDTAFLKKQNITEKTKNFNQAYVITWQRFYDLSNDSICSLLMIFDTSLISYCVSPIIQNNYFFRCYLITLT